MTKSKGFTLIELLVVIAIIAVLAVVVILTLNPAELLRQARDSNRVSDAATLKSAMALYLADVTTPVLGTPYDTGNTAANSYCFISASGTPAGLGIPANGCGVFSALGAAPWNTSSGRAQLATTRNVDSKGWLPVNFDSISSKSPISNLPVDPVNSGTYYYAYAATGSTTVAPTYKMVIKAMESGKYGLGGGNDVVSTDGGNVSSSLEFGSNMAL